MREDYRLAHVGLLFMVVFGALAGVEPVTAATGEDEDWLEMETDTFVVEYKEGYEDDASYIGNVSENAYAELEETLPETYRNPGLKNRYISVCIREICGPDRIIR